MRASRWSPHGSIFQAGSKYDPKDMPGLANAVASLLNEGTKTRTSRQISEESDSLGGSIGAGAGPDTLTALRQRAGRKSFAHAGVAGGYLDQLHIPGE